MALRFAAVAPAILLPARHRSALTGLAQDARLLRCHVADARPGGPVADRGRDQDPAGRAPRRGTRLHRGWRRARASQGRCALLRGGLRPSLTSAARGAWRSCRPGRGNGSSAEQGNRFGKGKRPPAESGNAQRATATGRPGVNGPRGRASSGAEGCRHRTRRCRRRRRPRGPRRPGPHRTWRPIPRPQAAAGRRRRPRIRPGTSLARKAAAPMRGGRIRGGRNRSVRDTGGRARPSRAPARPRGQPRGLPARHRGRRPRLRRRRAGGGHA